MKLSVVIPCRNEVLYIEECLAHIHACELPEQTEMKVFVVDGMSDDGTREKILELKNKFPNVFLVDNEKQLTPYAFNLGIYAGGKVDFVQIIGARHMVTPNYLLRCIERLTKNPTDWCVGGKIINEYLNEEGEIIAATMGTKFGMGIGNFRTLNESGYTDTVTSPMYPYHVFEKIGFFDEELIRNQDDDFNFRVEKAGGKIYFDAEIALRYYVRGNFSGLRRQFYQYGYWKVYVNKKHSTFTTIRQLVPPAFVLYTCFLVLTPLLPSFLKGLSWTPLIIYFILNFYSSQQLKRETGKPILAFVKTFLILHFSYGFGYLKGMLDFLLMGKKPNEKQKRLSR